jgi:predicted alpha/beta superfamily hydrolase
MRFSKVINLVWLPLLFMPLAIVAQQNNKVRIGIKLNMDKADYQNVFLAGNINGWNPADEKYRFSSAGELTLTLDKNQLVEFKLTKGGWNHVETSADGSDIENRVFKATRDTIIIIKIAAWKQDIGSGRKHTASVNVSVLDSAFYIPQLERYRTIRIYLPPDYNSSNKRYPVLYMADGQNCFDEYTASFGEWKVDETLDRFYDSCKKSMIVVAIDHGEKHRNQEYDPYDFKEIGKGEGEQFASFLVQTLKPFIDKKLRTFSDKHHTSIAGSSMGGIISMWAILCYPQVFGKAGVFSPAFWTARPIFNYAKQQLTKLKGNRIFFYAGGKESETMVPFTKEMHLLLSSGKAVQTELWVDDDAQHNEGAWAKWFPVYVKWL